MRPIDRPALTRLAVLGFVAASIAACSAGADSPSTAAGRLALGLDTDGRCVSRAVRTYDPAIGAEVIREQRYCGGRAVLAE